MVVVVVAAAAEAIDSAAADNERHFDLAQSRLLDSI